MRRHGTVFHVRVLGQPFGLYHWSRRRDPSMGMNRGLVLRVAGLGHVQVQTFRWTRVGRAEDGRRSKHGISVSWWGVAGRRRKKKIEVSFHL